MVKPEFKSGVYESVIYVSFYSLSYKQMDLSERPW